MRQLPEWISADGMHKMHAILPKFHGYPKTNDNRSIVSLINLERPLPCILSGRNSKKRLYAHPEFLAAAVPAYIAITCSLHVLLEGSSGCSLSTLVRFISDVCACQSPNTPKQVGSDSTDAPTSCQAHPRVEISRVLFGQESTAENIIGSSKPQQRELP
jgi:hypothetical protein